jgi:hypothetical protein
MTLETPGGSVVFNTGDHTAGVYASSPAYGDGFYLTDIDGLVAASIRNPTQDRPGRDGTIVFDFLFGPRFPVLQGVIVAGSSTEEHYLRHLLALACNSILRADGTLKWTPNGHDERQLTVRCLEALQISHDTPAAFQLALVAGDPTVYSSTEQEDTTSALSLGGQGGGLAFGQAVDEGGEDAWGFPFSFGEFTSGGSATLVNGGTVDAYPVVDITGPIVSPTLHNVTTGKVVSLSGLSLSSGDHIEIRMLDETVRLNGDPDSSQIDKLDIATSEFWPLVPGTNSIRLAAASFDAAETFATITWRDAYA